MDEAKARQIIEDYLAGHSNDADFDRALDYLKIIPQVSPDLSALFRDLDLPGGLSHEEAHELMPYYLEPLSRAQLLPQERRQFVAHLSQCPACAQMYLDLRGFEAEVKQFRQAEQATTAPAPAKPQPWPLLKPFVQSLSAGANRLRFFLTFSPARATGVREAGAYYLATGPSGQDDYAILFEDRLGEDVPAFLEASVTAWRSGPATCDLQIELTGRLEQGRQAGQTILITYDNRQFTLTTDSKGKAVLPGLAIDKLGSLKLEIEIKPA